MLTSHEIFVGQFMKNSERRSVYKQIKDLVKKAQTVAQKELEQRRQRLQAKLELEDKLYQEEFAENVKSRIDEDIRKRKDNLITIKSERDRRDKEFLQEMNIKRELEDCYEIREALTRRDMLQVKEAQLEQITEKQRALIRQRQNDEYWRKVCGQPIKSRNARIDDLRHVDICTKSNLALEVKQKAELAKLYYAELRRQMCEEYERRLREAQEMREQEVIENQFVHPAKSKAELLAEQRKGREELDHQLVENARLHAEEEEKYNKQLELVADDRNFCKRVAEQYIADQKDHLPTHPNWLIYQCPNKHFAVKCVSPERQGLSKSEVKLEREDACIEPCGCFARSPNECSNYSYLSPLKHGPNADQKLRNATLCLPRESLVVLR
ncbi:trichohyalin-like [Ceratitis capitata]|uniref:trichohyalin-like n=1 Tax=Ceratitis capitata TaxID=7213 RepID=UPI000C6C7983|nr:trichohyalin-like [Ceratitis capitata]